MFAFGIRFLICNLIITIILGLFLGAKRLFKKWPGVRMQYKLWLIVLFLLALPFWPTRLPGYRLLTDPIIAWCQMLSSLPNKNKALTPASALTQHSSTGWMNDFSLSVSQKAPSAMGMLLLAVWFVGMAEMTNTLRQNRNRPGGG